MIGFMALTGSLVPVVFMNAISIYPSSLDYANVSNSTRPQRLQSIFDPNPIKTKPHWSTWASKPGQQIHILRSVKAISIAHTDEVLSIDGHVQELFQKVAFLKTAPLHLVAVTDSHRTPIPWRGFQVFPGLKAPILTPGWGKMASNITTAPNKAFIILLHMWYDLYNFTMSMIINHKSKTL